MLLARTAAKAETILERLRKPDPHPSPLIQPYLGYSTPETVIIRGRVLADRQRKLIENPSSIFHNIRAMALNFVTHEIADVLVSSCGTETQTDEEGYFTLEIPRGDFPGNPVPIELPAFQITCDGAAAVTRDDAAFGVISDIDDTVMQTGAWRLYRNLWTTMTGNAASRHVFPDSAALIEKLHAGKNPIFYVSSSPWNLYGFLNQVFRNNRLVNGPKFLRDYGISETKFITDTHGSHKGDAIDTIFAANPRLDFYLIGDTGQHDAEVYLQAINRHPDRIKQVILRAAGKRDKADITAAKTIRNTGTDCFVGKDFTALV